MGANANNKSINDNKSNLIENKLYTIAKSIPLEVVNKVVKSLCKITIKNNEGNITGIGFFMQITDAKKCLITNYHIISRQTKKLDIEIEIYNQKKMNLKLTKTKRFIKFFPEPKDITIIDIKSSDEIYGDIEFLNYDLNYILGYKIYKDVDIFSIENPLGENPSFSNGKIININNYEFNHNIPTDEGSSGCPIILLNNNTNLAQVIGIHKDSGNSKELNCGTFIGEIFNDDLNKNNNYIIAEIEIKEDDINKDIRIINSYEEYQRNNNKNKELDESELNEEEINKCEIRINKKIIPFNYFYNFEKKGKYKIKYSFKIYLTKTNYLFASCDHLTNIDLSNFNTQIVTNMHCMFSQCKNLTNINLTNIDTQKVEDMAWMFWGCKSLTNIDLSYFNTQNVTSMLGMFSYCESLKNIDISNFNTQNVKYLWNIFEGCKSLTKINLSNFKTINLINMGRMFFGCESLKNVYISNFNTENVNDMSHLFFGCKSLKNIDILNFNTQNVTNMRSMFYGCESLLNLDVSNFNTQNVTDMSYMFSGCTSLTNLDISNFNTQNVVNSNSMFEKCDKLKNLDVSHFNTQNENYNNEIFNKSESIKLESIALKDKKKNLFENFSD